MRRRFELGTWRLKGAGGGTRPRLVCGAALLVDDVRLPSVFPLLSWIIDGWTIGGAAAM